MDALVQRYDLRCLLVSAALVIYIVYKIQTYRRLRAFKGPFSAGFTSFWHSWSFLTWNSHLFYQDVCEHYGKMDLFLRELIHNVSHMGDRADRSSWPQ